MLNENLIERLLNENKSSEFCRSECRNSFTSYIKHFFIKQTGKSLTGKTVNSFHTVILGSWTWWYRYKSLKHQHKLTAHLLIFNQVTSSSNIFKRFLNFFFFKPPIKWNPNVEISWFLNYFISCKSLNGEWYIINSKMKVESNDLAINEMLWLLEKIFWIYYR